MDKADLLACKDCYCLAARRTARAITRVYEQKLRAHGLRATQFSILATLALKGPTPMGELAEFLGLEATTLTRSTALMVRRGWTRQHRSSDGRQRLLSISESGLERLESALPAWQEAQTATSRDFAFAAANV